MNSFLSPSIIVHGGAGPIKDDSLPARLDGCKQAASVGWEILDRGGSAIDAVEAAVVVLEDNPLFNAGTGSTLNELGQVETDAAIMASDGLRAGALAAVSGIKNPIRLARRIMEDGRHVMFAGEGALLFARRIGFFESAPESLIVDSERKRWESKHGTVGCVAFDSSGNLAAATSTGGTFNKVPSRVGDSPLIGCGTYADRFGAASCTGHGEAIIRLVLGKVAVNYLAAGIEPEAAATKAIDLLDKELGSTGGIIVVDCHGKTAHRCNTLNMPVCSIHAGRIVTLAAS